MKKIKLFLRSNKFSLSLILQSSGAWLLVYLLISLTIALFGIGKTYSLKMVIDELMLGRKMDQMAVYVCLYFILIALWMVCEAAQRIAYDSIFKKALHLYDIKLLKKMNDLPLEYVDSSEGRDQIDDIRYLGNPAVYLVYRLFVVIQAAFSFGIAFVILIRFNVWITTLYLVLAIPGIILRTFFQKKAEELRREKAPDVRKFSYYRWMLTDAWPAKDVRMYDLTDSIRERYSEVKNEYLSENKKLDKQKLTSMLVAELALRMGEVLFILALVLKAMKLEISIGDLQLYSGMALLTCSSFQLMISNFSLMVVMATDVMLPIFDFWNMTPSGMNGKRRIDRFESLKFENVFFRYPHSENYVLSGVSFTLNKGDRLALVGINGAGKTTIIKLMIGLYDIESGSIQINDIPYQEYDINDVRKLFSVMFQNYVRYPVTLRENITMSNIERRMDDEGILRAIEESGAYEDIIGKLKNGLDSFMTRRFDDNGTELSGGQWQKVALARTYFKDAEIVIFDEPSAALDAEAEDRVFNNFMTCSSNKTGIMISHRISSARLSNKIIVLDKGRIVETGDHQELLKHGGLYARLYNTQKAKYVSEGTT